MKNPDFIGKKITDFYPLRYFNLLKYKELRINPAFKNLFEYRFFINLLWTTHDRVIVDRDNPGLLVKYFSSLFLSKNKMLYLLENIVLTFKKSVFPYLDLPEDTNLKTILDYISVECEKLMRQLNTDVYLPCFLIDFILIKKNVDLLDDIFHKISYLDEVKADFLYYDNMPGLYRPTYFKDLCDTEILKYKHCLKYKKFQLNNSDDFTPSSLQLKSPEYIRKYIADKLCTIDASQWKYIFISREDFSFFTNLLTNLFTGQPIDSNFSLILQPRCKTRLCPILNSLYHKFDPAPLKTNILFLSTLKKLSIFQNQSPGQIYTSLIKHTD